jgi:hypothetical protein
MLNHGDGVAMLTVDLLLLTCTNCQVEASDVEERGGGSSLAVVRSVAFLSSPGPDLLRQGDGCLSWER